MSERELFIAALQITEPAERTAWLDRECGDNAALRQRIDVLLQAFDKAGSLLENPAVAVGRTRDETITEVTGTVIGPYKLLQQIGEGGMGTVWMAEQTQPVQRKVALKVIKAGMDSRQVIARFEAERQALAMMDHVNIARVFDGGTTENGRPYFVMELVHGVPITKYCDDNHLTPRERLELFVPVCQAIQHAHQKGIIHRDIKPSNVMVTLYDGKPVPKVIDFGVAKATEQKLTERTLFTQYGTMVGTLEYMSPEQAEMSALGVDTRSDIYSMGVLLYELLTGSTPLTHKRMKEAAYAEILRMIKEEEPPKPSIRLSDSGEALASISAQRHMEPGKLTKLVRGELDWIVMKCLEKDRNRRYETANGFAADVQRYLADEPVQACPPSAGYRLRKFVRRNKRPVLAASLVLLVLVAGIIGTTWGMFRATFAEAEAVREAGEKTVALGEKTVALREKVAALATAKANELEAHKQEALAKESATAFKEQEQLARRRFHAAQINLALQAWEAGQPARTLELLESLRPRFDQEDLRGFEWYYLWRRCHSNLRRTLSGPTGEIVYALAVTPDGKTLVSGSTDGGVRVWDVATGKERAVLTGHTSQIWRLAISPDGKTLASGSMDNTVKLWDLGTSELLATLGGRTQMVRSVAFSPDGKTLAAGTEDCALELWDVATRKRRFTLPALSAPALALAYSPNGKMLATGQGWNQSNVQGGVKVWDVTLEPPRLIFQREVTNCAAFSPDSKLLATCSYHAKVWSVPSGELKAAFASSGVESVAFSADGKTVVLGCHDRTVKVWDYSTGATRTVGVHLGRVDTVAFVPQSDLLASGSNDGTVKIWRAGLPQDEITFAHDSTIRSLAFTPNSQSLVVGSDTTTPMLSAATGKKTTTLPVSGVLAVSADANLLAARAPDGKRVIWDAAAAQARAVLPVGTDLKGAAFSRDGNLLVLVTWFLDAPRRPYPVELWDLATSRVRLKIAENIYGAAFSPNGKTLATGSQFGPVALWDAATGQKRLTLQPHEGPAIWAFSVAFSSDGKLLASGNSAGALRLWDVETGKLKMSFKGHTHGIRSVAFSPDGKSLLSGSDDKTARLWDVETGQELLALKGQNPVRLVAFSPDGKRIATAAGNKVTFWLAATEPEATAFRVELDPDDANSPRAANHWGDRLRASNRPQEAENAYGQALARLEKLVAVRPDLLDYRQELAYTLLTALPSSADQEQAEQAQRRFKEVTRALPAERKIKLANLLHRRGHVQVDARQWKYAVADFAASIELTPDNLQWYQCRARAFAELEAWQRAAEDFAVGLKWPNANVVVWYESALLQVQLGQQANYQKACAHMLESFSRPDVVDWTVWTCVLAPHAVADWTKPLKLAEKAQANDPKNYGRLNHLGAVLYRAGRFHEAARRLAEADAAFKEPSTQGVIVYNWLFQAMSHQRLGHNADAVSWLKKAVQAIDEPPPANGGTLAPIAWNRRLTLQLLRREAEQLLAKKSP